MGQEFCELFMHLEFEMITPMCAQSSMFICEVFPMKVSEGPG